MMSLLATGLWPPAYKVKKHRRAKHVKLRVVKPACLEITVPYRFNLHDIPALLEEHRAWITKQLLIRQSQPSDELPTQVVMPSIHETWTIRYMACDRKLEIIHRPQQEMVLMGYLHDKKKCKEKLIAWVKQHAHLHLSSQLNKISEKIQLTYQQVHIRDQRTIWGSCTAKKTIHLNYKLLFLPSHLVTHIMIHELCHTQYLNHSKHFWALVAQHDPAWQRHRRELREAEQFIPGWIDRD